MSVTRRSHARPSRAALLAQLALCALLASAGVAGKSVPIDNGDFENGFAGWLVEPTQVAVGSASASASASVGDAGSFIGTRHPVALVIFAAAEGSSGPSSAQAGIHLQHPGFVGGRFLDFRAGGGWGISSFGGVPIKNRCEVVVRGTGPAAGLEARFLVAGNEFPGGAPCTTGFFADFGAFPMQRSLDLAAQGFLAGDPVEIELYWDALVVAEETCQQGDMIGTIYFDNFAFRN